MLKLLRVDHIICQLALEPSLADPCSWRQWAPLAAAYLAALVCRAIGGGRLYAFAAGVALFFLAAIGLSDAPLDTPFVVAHLLFLVPLALASALFGLIFGDLARYLKKRYGCAGKSQASCGSRRYSLQILAIYRLPDH